MGASGPKSGTPARGKAVFPALMLCPSCAPGEDKGEGEW